MEDKWVYLIWIFLMMVVYITSQIKKKVDKIEKILEDKNDK
tara:strand:- start:2882 stop:3004 length:123 start_codon:yes stop_codon:yes gene_type:complete